ncbi:hypothetical protein EWI61_04005 [Methylolobus aquaticus]|nr:hypothetical protein EWI61_04005 [Methylolobus aquaticus]
MESISTSSCAFTLLLGNRPALATDTACQPIVDAGKAQWRAPMVHDRKVLSDGYTYEIIKRGDMLYLKNGATWRMMPSAMAKILTDPASIEKAGQEMRDCRQTGTEMIGPMSTVIYSFTSTLASTPRDSGTSRIWIGSDGLPYRQESKEFNSTTVYAGVTAPALGK